MYIDIDIFSFCLVSLNERLVFLSFYGVIALMTSGEPQFMHGPFTLYLRSKLIIIIIIDRLFLTRRRYRGGVILYLVRRLSHTYFFVFSLSYSAVVADTDTWKLLGFDGSDSIAIDQETAFSNAHTCA